MDLTVGQLTTFGAFLFLSGAFSGTETALTAMSRLKIQKLIEERGGRAKLLQNWIDEPERYLTTLLIGNNLVNVATASMATLLVEQSFHGTGRSGLSAVAIATFIVTLLILVFGEITPKHFCKRHAPRIAMLTILPLHYLSIALRPAEKILSWVSGALIFVISLGRTPPEEDFGEAELRAAVQLSGEAGVLEEQEQSIISRVLRFGDTTIREIMVPRVKMSTLPVDAAQAEVTQMVIDSGRRRIPVYEENRDKIVGIVHVHDLLEQAMSGEVLDLSAQARPAVFVPETKPVDEMLAFFRKERVHMAIVVNEYGGVEGLVTLEDVLEELVGEIQDEHDQPITQIKTLEDGRLRLEGSVELNELERVLEVEFESTAVSVGGWMIEQLGHIPAVDEKVRLEGWEFTVSAATDKIVQQVEVVRTSQPG